MAVGKASPYPQVISIAQLGRNRRLSLKKVPRSYLGLKGDVLRLHRNRELLLRGGASLGGDPLALKGSAIELPAEACDVLALREGDLVAMIARNGALALKRLEVSEEPGERARVVDHETATVLSRTLYSNPLPDAAIPALREQTAALRLGADPLEFLRRRDTLGGWVERQRLGLAAPGDGRLRDTLLAERRASQAADGSWDGEVVLTARRLLELRDLGLGTEDAAVQRAANWLLARDESTVNPGMWFLSDALVAKQAAVLQARALGLHERFRNRPRGEMKRVLRGDPLWHEPCGPRIIWPSALVVKALVALGLEAHPRVQRELGTLQHARWCECEYQHGVPLVDPQDPAAERTLTHLEGAYREAYRLGGIRKVADLGKAAVEDAGQPRVHKLPRVSGPLAAAASDDVAVYELGMPDHIQHCELLTVWGLAGVSDPRLQRLAKAYLWSFAATQTQAGDFTGAERFSSSYFVLSVFASYDTPISRLVLLRALPWLVDAQNADGSWGAGDQVDAATAATLAAFRRLGGDLPVGLASARRARSN